MSTRRQPTKRITGPIHDLESVQRLANLAIIGDKASKKTADTLGENIFVAQAYARKLLINLTTDDYAHSVTLDYTPKQDADVYGVVNEDGSWYIKFYVLNGRVHITSCHPPEGPLLLNSMTIQ